MSKSLNWARSNERQRMREHGSLSIADEAEQELKRLLPHRPRRFRPRRSKQSMRDECDRALREWQQRRPARPSQAPPSGLPWEDGR
jgi:hypothetical protein